MNNNDELKALVKRMEYHQTELNKILAEVIRITDLNRKNLPIESTTDRARILSTLEDGALLTAKQITSILLARGILVRDVAQKLCGMEKDSIIGCNRQQRWKRYFIIPNKEA